MHSPVPWFQEPPFSRIPNVQIWISDERPSAHWAVAVAHHRLHKSSKSTMTMHHHYYYYYFSSLPFLPFILTLPALTSATLPAMTHYGEIRV
ncbi:hypothetical protein OUZ56_002783 [Daphnia magna]|uniref:Uncharacterized protein n=1 Tax=Daphnia magna TaxID=35525 RepID=A0ABR0A6Q9_9CRUS|nr:hypothetical protein OUZ56_002783 [Daphnia magna]